MYPLRKIRALAIAPYEGMAKLILDVANDYDMLDITTYIGNLDIGARIAKEQVNNHYDVIISRGGTANLIRESVDIPVVEVSISAQDVLSAIKSTENFEGKFVIAGFSNTTEYAKMICEIMNYDIPIITFQNSEDVYEKLKELQDNKVSLVISDMIGSMTARKLGMNSILLSSGAESIKQAFDEIIKLMDAFDYLNKQKNIFQNVIFDHISNIVIYDENKKIWFSNFSSDDIKNNISNILIEYMDLFFEKDCCNIEKVVDETIYSFRVKHYFYNDSKYVAVSIEGRINILNTKDKIFEIYNKNYSIMDVYSNANFVGDISTYISDYAKVSLPVFLLGENGTGKDTAARMIYENSQYQNNPMYIIDCKKLNDKKFNYMIHKENSPLYTLNTTIYFKNVSFLSELQIKQLMDVDYQTKLRKRNRLIFSMVENEDTYEKYKDIYHSIINNFDCMVLKLPSLRERKKDIPNIVTLYINQISIQYGKQVVGFHEDAMEEFQKFDWVYNLKQLKRVIKELVITTKSSYISKEETLKMLSKENLSCSKENINISLDLDKSLQEINDDIIRIVLEQENNNKEKAAKRLGISRSTLWRMLKNIPSDT